MDLIRPSNLPPHMPFAEPAVAWLDQSVAQLAPGPRQTATSLAGDLAHSRPDGRPFISLRDSALKVRPCLLHARVWSSCMIGAGVGLAGRRRVDGEA